MKIPYQEGIGLIKIINSDFDLKYKNKKVRINKNIHWLINQDNLECDCCKSTPSHFAFRKEGGRYHFELHDKRGIKFTIDHILPRCVGGQNIDDNFKPLCSQCNSWKSKFDTTLKKQVEEDLNSGIILLLEEIK